MKTLVLFLLLSLCFTTSNAQWTEPVLASPQFSSFMRSIWISNDNQRLYLTGGLSTIFVSTRDSLNGTWGTLQALPPQVNATGTQTSACESPHGDTLYFTSNSDERQGERYGWLDVYYCIRTDTGWGPAINCGPNVNGPGREWSVNISRDGSMLLLASHGLNGGASHNLYYCLKQSDGSWGLLTSFGDLFNTWWEEEHPSLSPDNMRLFFYRDDQGLGSLYESRIVQGAWQLPTRLPPNINTPFTDMNPCIANDGCTLWFRSDRTGEFQIYTATDTTRMSLSPHDRPLDRSKGRTLAVYSVYNGILAIELSNPVMRAVNSVTLYNILGRQVKQALVTFNAHDHKMTGLFPMGELPVGTYIISVRLSDKTLSTKYVLIK